MHGTWADGWTVVVGWAGGTLGGFRFFAFRFSVFAFGFSLLEDRRLSKTAGGVLYV